MSVSGRLLTRGWAAQAEALDPPLSILVVNVT